MKNFILPKVSIAVLILMLSCKPDFIIPNSPFPASNIILKTDTLARGLVIPYSLEVLGEEDYLLTDRRGRLFHYKNGQLTKIKGTPRVRNFQDPGIALVLHGGLMEVKAHPAYPSKPWIYISHLSLDLKTIVRRFKLEENRVVDMEKIFETSSGRFLGSNARMVWEDSSHFFLNVGGSAPSTVSTPKLISQDLSQDWGKIHRLKEDGSIPADNPILPGFTRPTSIWSYGHRDATGLFYETSTQILFSVEHGPKGGDEFNVIQKGKNYGWPLFSQGIDYSGAEVSTLTEDSASSISVLPIHHWTVPTEDGGQAIAPGFLWKVVNSSIPEWNGKFLLSSLFYRRALLYDPNNQQTIGLPITGRIRYMRQIPDGDFIALIERTGVGKRDGLLVKIGKE